MTFERFTADPTSFYCDNKPFYPAVQSDLTAFHTWSNSVRVPLSAAMHDDLDWSHAQTEAERIVKAGKTLFWEIDFHLRCFSRVDSTTFFAHMRALEEAVRLMTPFALHTVGLCLYRGPIDLCHYFPLSEWEDPFFEWLEELAENSMQSHELRRSGNTPPIFDGSTAGAFTQPQWQRLSWSGTSGQEHYYRLFCMECFSDYMHRLISFLPDGLLPFVFFDSAAVISPAACAQLLSKERLVHLHAGIMNSKGIELSLGGLTRGWVGECESPVINTSAPTTALCLPSMPFCDRKTLEALDVWMASSASAFRILCEEKLTEEWEGVDHLVLPSVLSSQGARKLQGFQATGGEITLLL